VINILLIAPNPTASSGAIESAYHRPDFEENGPSAGAALRNMMIRHGIAKALGLEVPGQVQQLADELIE
jgi:hypothetical protein